MEKITKENIKDIEISATPAILFDTLDVLKETCEVGKISHEELIGLFTSNNQDVDPVKRGEQLTQKFIEIAKVFYSEYNRKERKPGILLNKLILLISEATSIRPEVIEKTDTKLILQLLLRFMNDTNTEVKSSFL